MTNYLLRISVYGVKTTHTSSVFARISINMGVSLGRPKRPPDSVVSTECDSEVEGPPSKTGSSIESDRISNDSLEFCTISEKTECECFLCRQLCQLTDENALQVKVISFFSLPVLEFFWRQIICTFYEVRLCKSETVFF